MLVLSRRIGEEITLPDLGVRIRVLKTRRAVAVVGVAAPAQVRVLRGELTPFDAGSKDRGARHHPPLRSSA